MQTIKTIAKIIFNIIAFILLLNLILVAVMILYFTVILLIYALLQPFQYLVNAGVSDLVLVSFLIIYGATIASILTYAGYKLFQKLASSQMSYRDIGKLKLQTAKKKQSTQDYSRRIATPLQELPTADSIQRLISEDGEIPDEALQKRHPH